MANPNIVNVTVINGKITPLAVTTSATAIITVAPNTVVKVNSVSVTNTSNTNYTVTADLLRSAVSYAVAYQIVIPPNSTVVLIGRDNMLYLEENDSLRLLASANSVLVATASYEVFN